MAGGAVIAAAAARRRRRQEIVDIFRLADATAPERSRSLAELGLQDNRDVHAFIREGVLAAGARSGELYLSEAAYLAHRGAYPASARRVLILVLVALAILLVGLVVAVGPQQL
jgi:hypothetical protein